VGILNVVAQGTGEDHVVSHIVGPRGRLFLGGSQADRLEAPLMLFEVVAEHSLVEVSNPMGGERQRAAIADYVDSAITLISGLENVDRIRDLYFRKILEQPNRVV